MKKIRPFFKSARQADSKNAKTFWKSLFFNEILLRKPLKSHATSQIFCSKKLPWNAYAYTWIWKNLMHCFKSRNCNCDYLTLRIGNLTPYEDHFPKIILICINICHHYVNHHGWSVQIGFWVSTLLPLCYFKIIVEVSNWNSDLNIY